MSINITKKTEIEIESITEGFCCSFSRQKIHLEIPGLGADAPYRAMPNYFSYEKLPEFIENLRALQNAIEKEMGAI